MNYLLVLMKWIIYIKIRKKKKKPKTHMLFGLRRHGHDLSVSQLGNGDGVGGCSLFPAWHFSKRTHTLHGGARTLSFFLSFFFFFFVLLPFLGLLPVAYGGSQARGRIRAVATRLHHSNSNVGSELHLRPTHKQLVATLDP